MRSFSITTLGCKVNRYESEAVAERLSDCGWRRMYGGSGAHLCVINTCAVTQKAAMQSRQAVRKMIRNHPGAAVMVTGCYAQVAPDVFASMSNVCCVVGNALKGDIHLLANRQGEPGPGVVLVEDLSAARLFHDLPLTRFGRRTRAFLKVQDGCDAFCSYCIVPYARGRSRSLSPGTAMERVVTLKKQGYKEIVLCGIHIGRYGQDLVPETSLMDLIRSIDGPQGIERLRLSSIEPMELSDDIIAHVAASERFCPHLHIPLQSGDDHVLKAMRRPYCAQAYRDLIYRVAHTIPDVSIGVDIMCGFPGETERAFENTCRLVEDLPIAYLHVFPFSVQKGTAAEHLPNHVSSETKKRRCKYLRKLGDVKRKGFYEKFTGAVLDVLVEGKRDRTTGLLKGLTSNYIPMLLEGDDRLSHRTVKARIQAVKDGRVYGKPVFL